MNGGPLVTIEYAITGWSRPLLRYSYHVPRVGDRIELVDPDDETVLVGDVTSVTWADDRLRIEVLRDD